MEILYWGKKASHHKDQYRKHLEDYQDISADSTASIPSFYVLVLPANPDHFMEILSFASWLRLKKYESYLQTDTFIGIAKTKKEAEELSVSLIQNYYQEHKNLYNFASSLRQEV